MGGLLESSASSPADDSSIDSSPYELPSPSQQQETFFAPDDTPDLQSVVRQRQTLRMHPFFDLTPPIPRNDAQVQLKVQESLPNKLLSRGKIGIPKENESEILHQQEQPTRPNSPDLLSYQNSSIGSLYDPVPPPPSLPRVRTEEEVREEKKFLAERARMKRVRDLCEFKDEEYEEKVYEPPPGNQLGERAWLLEHDERLLQIALDNFCQRREELGLDEWKKIWNEIIMPGKEFSSEADEETDHISSTQKTSVGAARVSSDQMIDGNFETETPADKWEEEASVRPLMTRPAKRGFPSDDSNVDKRKKRKKA